ncbi:NAD-dependent protein deacetylase sirtuin-3-like [Pelodytes ibericus]
MNRVPSTTKPPKAPKKLVEKTPKPVEQTVAKSTAAQSNGQKPVPAKSAANIKKTRKEHGDKNINDLIVVDQQNSQRKIHLAKFSLSKRISETKPPEPRSKIPVLKRIADLILKKRCKKIIVMVGAGISTPSGIPDFRTPGSGLYDNLQKYKIPYPEAIFDIAYFPHDPLPFFTLAKELYPGKYKPNLVHYFVKLLHDKGLLLRCYTQNIDGLERLAGIPPRKLVEAHGTFSSASCHLCYRQFSPKEARNCIMEGTFPYCTVCEGLVKPDIVFFGEDLPKRFWKFRKDFPKADLLIIMGTSLETDPFANLVNHVRSSVPRLLLNRDRVGPFKRKSMKPTDFAELGDLCDLTRKLVSCLNWQREIEELLKPGKG